MKNAVRVTIRANQYEGDFDLPSSVKLNELYPRVSQALKQDAPSTFRGYTSVVFELDGCGLLNGEATLLDYGVRTGDYLDVVRKEKYDGFKR